MEIYSTYNYMKYANISNGIWTYLVHAIKLNTLLYGIVHGNIYIIHTITLNTLSYNSAYSMVHTSTHLHLKTRTIF